MIALNSIPRRAATTLAIASIIAGTFLIGCGGNNGKRPEEAAATGSHADSGATEAGSGAKADGGTGKPSGDEVAMKPVTADTVGCGRLYSGTLDGTIPVVMILCRVGDELSGHYRYVKVGKDIPIQGHVAANGAVVIYEWGDGPKKQTGNFLGRFMDPERIEGTWQTPKGDRSMPFVLTRGAAAGGAAGGTTGAWSFSGSWTLVDGEGATFDLDLTQTGSRLSGRHCATTANATRVDCWMNDGEPDTSKISIVGTVKGEGEAEVTFTSAYGLNGKGKPVTGTALIARRGEMIRWTIIGKPDGDEYLPFDARLKRVKTGGK